MIFWPNTKINEPLTKTASLNAAYSPDFIAGKRIRRIFVHFAGFSWILCRQPDESFL